MIELMLSVSVVLFAVSLLEHDWCLNVRVEYQERPRCGTKPADTRIQFSAMLVECLMC